METRGSSILETLGEEIISVMSPVSITMFLVVLLIYTLYNPSTTTTTTIRTAANLIYLESPTDPTSQKLQGSILNAVVFILILTLTTFLLLLLFYYRFNNFLLYYTRFSVFFIFSVMGSSILISLIQTFSIPVDVFTFYVLLFNVTVLGTVSVFSNGVPIVVKQGCMVVLGVVVAAWFTRLPEWTTWIVLVALAVYDLVAVLAPGGPLKLLVELASSRDEELPALVYESRPNVGGRRSSSHRGSGFGMLIAPGIGMMNVDDNSYSNSGDGVELQELLRNVDVEIGGNEARRGNRDEGIEEVREDESGENRALLGGNERRDDDDNEEEEEVEEGNSRGIKLGMGDFIFYSVLVGRAAMYDLMTVYACYLAIISGLGCTLILLAVCRHALPALPISIALGVMFYFLTRLLMEPFVVGASTNLVMF